MRPINFKNPCLSKHYLYGCFWKCFIKDAFRHRVVKLFLLIPNNTHRSSIWSKINTKVSQRLDNGQLRIVTVCNTKNGQNKKGKSSVWDINHYVASFPIFESAGVVIKLKCDWILWRKLMKPPLDWAAKFDQLLNQYLSFRVWNIWMTEMNADMWCYGRIWYWCSAATCWTVDHTNPNMQHKRLFLAIYSKHD